MVFFSRNLLLALALVSAPAAAQTVDFETSPLGNNPNPLTIGNATFTTPGGFNYLTTFSSTTALCPSTSSSSPADCSALLEVLFAGNASTISFNFAANNTVSLGSDIGDVSIFSGAALLGTVDVLVLDGSAFTYDLVSLTGFSNVTRIVITSTDSGGVVYDDFAFSLNAVPEPSTWAMMLIGFGGIGYSMRRRRRSSVIAKFA